jgi:DDE family transposase
VRNRPELRAKFRAVWPLLDERARRLMAASEAITLGYGGVSLVRRACGLSRKAIAKGVREIQARAVLPAGRIRRSGGGRKPITVSDPRLLETLEAMIDDQTRGDPESPLRWICQSTRTIAHELVRRHHPVSHAKVAQLLHDLDYSLQSNRKTEEGDDHPDRDAQFRHIAAAVKRCLAQRSPVISVDTKKKELIGNYVNAGQQWRPAKQPTPVRGTTFPRPTCRERIRLAFTTSGATPALSMSALIMIRAPLPSRRSAAGGVMKADGCIPTRRRC